MQSTLFIVLCAVAPLMLVVPSDAQDQESAQDEIAELRKQLGDVLSRIEALEARHGEDGSFCRILSSAHFHAAMAYTAVMPP